MNFFRHVLLLSSLGTFLMAAVSTGAYAQKVDVAELMAPGPLPDRALGSEKAPITIVEYSSMTCSHCARFYGDVFQPFKKKYIDTGKVRFIMREFPLDPVASSAFALARCQPEDKYHTTIGTLFEQQKNWSFVSDPAKSSKALFAISKKLGFTKQSYEACMADTKLTQSFTDIRQKAKDKFGVKGVPAFFINGEKLQGEKTLDAFDKAIEPLLKGS